MKSKKPLIIGNWKMNLTCAEAVEFAQSLRKQLSTTNKIVCGICPSFIFLKDICTIVAGSAIFVGAQNIYSERVGAYTGEVSAFMVKEAGCSHVIIGHSERRHIFAETDAFINTKIKTALSANLKPILCIGEKLHEREESKTWQVIENQLKNGLRGIGAEHIQDFVVAYEPVWAIGTGKTASPEQANEAHTFIRALLVDVYGKDIARAAYILYGGSVKPENTSDLMAQEEVDGLLVGGASIHLESFLKILGIASNFS
jgi:triosephosphate isomerase (TIM)